ncbi:hypothetical protein MBLNU459_g1036t1 [Dothideomycetes sp. NU459]
MFWRFGGYANISSIDTILDKPDVTLDELLDESDLIQELKQQNSKLIEYLREDNILHSLLRYVVADKPPSRPDASQPDDSDAKSPGISFFGKKPKSRSRSKSVNKRADPADTDDDTKEAQRKKYAYVACEVLSSEVWSITEALLESQDQLREFWDYMKRPAPLDALQAGYFTKVNEALLDKKTDEMLAFFKSLDNVVPRMLQHVDCPMVMDLLLKIVSLEKHEGGQGIVDWLQSQHLIPILLSYLSPDNTLATQTAAGDFLKAIITISANATTQDQTVIGPNELTRQLVSEQCIATLIKDMLQGGNALTVGVGIIIEVIRKNNSDYDLDNQVGPEPKTSDPIYLGTLLRQFAHHVPDFMRLIRSPASKKPDLKAAFGAKIEPLGFDRFKTCELMAELLHCSNMGLLNERGSEAEITQRDAKREKLKAEGKLDAQQSQNLLDEPFASSVDSHGFHHAERPDDDLSGSPDEIKRLEVQNASDEDGFETVAVPETEALPDEVSFDDFNEKLEETIPSSPTQSRDPSSTHHNPDDRSETPTREERLSASPPGSNDSPSTPTGIHSRVGGLQIGSPEQASDEPQPEGKRRVSLLTQQLQQQIQESELNEFSDNTQTAEPPVQDVDVMSHPEDKPAPLFSSKTSPSKSQDTSSDPSRAEEEKDSPSHSTATLQPGGVHASDSDDRPSWETDLDGSPVVGDLLKIMFVEHQVVPTILDFFFRFPWNNFLHNVVYDVVQQVFNGSFERGYNRTLAIDLFCNSRNTELVSAADITQRILDGQIVSDRSQQEKGMRLGYMGHLTLIAEEVLKLHDRQPPELLGEQIMERITREDWIRYLEGTLTETRDKDNAVLGGVKPDNAMGTRQVGGGMLGQGGGGGFASSSNSSALANAGLGGVPADSMALQEASDSIGGYDIGGGSAGLLSGFGNGDDDDDEEMDDGAEGERREKAVSDDEQIATSSTTATPTPLNVAPSRARRQLALRLAARQKESSDIEASDPDAADPIALETSETLEVEPLSDLPDLDLSAPAERDLQEAGLPGLRVSGLRVKRTGETAARATAADRFSVFGSGLDSNSSSSSSSLGSEDEGEEDEGSRRHGHKGDDDDDDDDDNTSSPRKGRRPSTTEAKFRIPLDDDEADRGGVTRSGLATEGAAESPFADPVELSEDSSDDSSDEGDVVEIRPRRTS